MRPRDAFYAKTEIVKLEDACGRVAAEFVTPYRPGIPIFVPGERINDEIVDYLETGSAEGMYAEGCADQALETLRVVD
jgi:arginine/lysine/ornithine decarboxylase